MAEDAPVHLVVSVLGFDRIEEEEDFTSASARSLFLEEGVEEDPEAEEEEAVVDSTGLSLASAETALRKATQKMQERMSLSAAARDKNAFYLGEREGLGWLEILSIEQAHGYLVEREIAHEQLLKDYVAFNLAVDMAWEALWQNQHVSEQRWQVFTGALALARGVQDTLKAEQELSQTSAPEFSQKIKAALNDVSTNRKIAFWHYVVYLKEVLSQLEAMLTEGERLVAQAAISFAALREMISHVEAKKKELHAALLKYNLSGEALPFLQHLKSQAARVSTLADSVLVSLRARETAMPNQDKLREQLAQQLVQVTAAFHIVQEAGRGVLLDPEKPEAYLGQKHTKQISPTGSPSIFAIQQYRKTGSPQEDRITNASLTEEARAERFLERETTQRYGALQAQLASLIQTTVALCDELKWSAASLKADKEARGRLQQALELISQVMFHLASLQACYEAKQRDEKKKSKSPDIGTRLSIEFVEAQPSELLRLQQAIAGVQPWFALLLPWVNLCQQNEECESFLARCGAEVQYHGALKRKSSELSDRVAAARDSLWCARSQDEPEDESSTQEDRKEKEEKRLAHVKGLLREEVNKSLTIAARLQEKKQEMKLPQKPDKPFEGTE